MFKVSMIVRNRIKFEQFTSKHDDGLKKLKGIVKINGTFIL